MTFVPSNFNAASLTLLEGTLRHVPDSGSLGLFAHTISLMGPVTSPELPYLHEERTLLVQALNTQAPEHIRTARALYQRPGRLFYALAPFAEKLNRALDVGDISPETSEASAWADDSAQLAWTRMVTGASDLIDQPVVLDPAGDLSNLMAVLDHRGLQAHWKKRKETGDPNWVPPPAFAFLSRNETPERLRRYNRGDTDRVGNVAFDFPPELQTVVPPSAYRNLVRSRAGLQFVIPASHVLADQANEEWARQLPPNAVVATGIKGLCDGKTPREHFDDVFGKAGRPNAMVGIYGFMPATRWLQELRGERRKSQVWEVLLTDPAMANGLAMARRMAGPEAEERTETYRGVSYLVVENLAFDPPIRFHVVSDPDVIRTNEIASIYKNLQALHLGQSLFKEMEVAIKRGMPPSPELFDHFRKFYSKAMRESKDDIVKALELENIPANKRVILPFVDSDMDGSWGTSQFEEIYALLQMIFGPKSSFEEWSRGMILLKVFIRNYFSVRNPCYGLCVAANAEASVANRWLAKKKVEEVARALMAEGRMVNARGEPMTWSQVRDALELDDEETHYRFSMIPAGLLPEALQIAEQLPGRLKRKGRKIEEMPASFQSAYLAVQRMQHRFLFDPKIYRDIVDLTKVFATIFKGSADAQPERYVQHLTDLHRLLMRALKEAEINESALGEVRDTTNMLRDLSRRLGYALPRIAKVEGGGPDSIVWFNQAVIEMLTAANRFAVLAMSDRRIEGEHLIAKVEKLRTFFVPRKVDGGTKVAAGGIDHLFSRNGTASSLTEREQKALLSARDQLFHAMGEGLINLTYQMNLKLHNEKSAIEKKDILNSFRLLAGSLEMAAEALGEHRSAVNGLRNAFSSILARLSDVRLSAENKSRVYQAVIEVLIHIRRFLVFPADWAILEVEYTANRLNQIDQFLAGKEASPLWHYRKNGKSNQPPPAL